MKSLERNSSQAMPSVMIGKVWKSYDHLNYSCVCFGLTRINTTVTSNLWSFLCNLTSSKLGIVSVIKGSQSTFLTVSSLLIYSAKWDPLISFTGPAVGNVSILAATCNPPFVCLWLLTIVAAAGWKWKLSQSICWSLLWYRQLQRWWWRRERWVTNSWCCS